MKRYFARRWRRPPTAGSRPRRPWLESLEGRDSPSALLYEGFLNTPLEGSPALFSTYLSDGEAAGETAARGAQGAGAWGERGALPLNFDPGPAAFATLLAEDPIPDGIGEGGLARPTQFVKMASAAITEFYASEGEDGWWTFAGHVQASSPGGLIVSFGGLPSLQGQTVEVETDGTFSFTIQLQRNPCEEGLATAQTTDWNGQPSNVAQDYVRQTNCPN